MMGFRTRHKSYFKTW